MRKERQVSERFAKEAGIGDRRWSTRRMQNPWAKEQDLAAAELEKEGKLTADEAARRKSYGEFIPEDVRERVLADFGSLKMETGGMTSEEIERLRALGYLQ